MFIVITVTVMLMATIIGTAVSRH